MKKWIAASLISLMLFTGQQASAFDLHRGQTIRVLMPEQVTSVATTALELLEEDLQTVLSADVQLASSPEKADIVCAFDQSLPKEGFSWKVSDRQLSIKAADSHGVAYGLLELSHRLGVSPWEDWVDATPMPQESLHLASQDDTAQWPKVAYRGIFINDEDWGLNPWATRQEPEALVIRQGRINGAVGPKVTERIFKLMLRLRLNYYWPPMHECTQPFFLTPGNREVAARYGIYIGGSHCEPMASSAAAEWGIRGEGDYNYVTNRDGVQRFWQQRLDNVKHQEIVYTLGMRGVHDGAMQGVGTKEEKRHYLQQVIDDQRLMLASTLGCVVTEIPQVFVPYKEVLDVYLDGLKVPDDVTLMWTDDNYGYVRHYPNAEERDRKGGNGLYYHVSYWGRPHDYCWLATLSPYLMEQQLTEAYHRGIQKIWMLNVGDIKPAEVQIHVFAQLAWHGVAEHLTQGSRAKTMIGEMLEDIFPMQSQEFCQDMQSRLEESYRLAWDRKPEHMAGTRVEEKDKAYWNEIRPIDYWTSQQVAQRLADYKQLADDVERLSSQVGANRQDAFFELIRYPIQAAAQMNEKYLCAANCKQAQDSIHTLTQRYNKGMANGGKWNGIMSDAPRGLRVFQSVLPDDLPSYGDGGTWQPLLIDSSACTSVLTGLGTKGWMLAVGKGEACHFTIDDLAGKDSLTVAVHLLPTLPVDGGKLTFEVTADDTAPCTVDYETYDRSEEWKRNVLRNCAVRIVTLPLKQAEGCQSHRISFRALTDNVILDQLYINRGRACQKSMIRLLHVLFLCQATIFTEKYLSGLKSLILVKSGLNTGL